ncbi:hypothetical protein EIP86_002243 [Pleurotus ostreatoroseus]|nr:hypothetical protein EIP86_002243 [Pleurotus ostreatoroseus]
MTLPTSSIFTTIHCDAPAQPAVTSRAAAALETVKSAVSVPENELKRWKRLFESNAKTVVEGQKFLNTEQFVSAIAPQADLTKIGRAQYATLFRVADSNKRGLISWDDFVIFETILKRPDADYYMAFQYFDVDSSGTISYDEFKNVFRSTINGDSIPFDFDWCALYSTDVLRDNEFTQMMKGLQGERLRQAFKYFDKDEDGFIRPEQFKRIILEVAGHKLSDAVIERLPTLCTLTPGGRITYSEVVAFHNVIREMDMVERIIREATGKSKDGRIDQGDFLNHCASRTRYALFTPMEASIIFHFAARGESRQRLALIDFAQLLDPRWSAPTERPTIAAEGPTTLMSVVHEIAHSLYNFGLGGVAGAFGATMVYPIDLGTAAARDISHNLAHHLPSPQTRMQNQRSSVVGQLLYKNSFDCVRKVFHNEGFVGFYRGLGPQLIGVAPEKAIKLTVNDFIRKRAMDPETGRIALSWELIAGGSAGGCQVIFTNPLEIVKIRLQMQGEAAKLEGAVPKGAAHIVRQLGLFGLYKGASACLLRDIPFSAIYFPAYAHLKKDIFNEGYNDVVKTRLQTEAKTGQTNYKGMGDAFVKIWREEGFKAFFKGGPARIVRSSPQFGFTLVAYEYLHKYLPYPFKDEPRDVETSFTSQPEELSKVRARNALRILLDVHGDFGPRTA